jgi:hypothetical protein
VQGVNVEIMTKLSGVCIETWEWALEAPLQRPAFAGELRLTAGLAVF